MERVKKGKEWKRKGKISEEKRKTKAITRKGEQKDKR